MTTKPAIGYRVSKQRFNSGLKRRVIIVYKFVRMMVESFKIHCTRNDVFKLNWVMFSGSYLICLVFLLYDFAINRRIVLTLSWRLTFNLYLFLNRIFNKYTLNTRKIHNNASQASVSCYAYDTRVCVRYYECIVWLWWWIRVCALIARQEVAWFIIRVVVAAAACAPTALPAAG